jgi:CheY-like chemotaxis protein
VGPLAQVSGAIEYEGPEAGMVTTLREREVFLLQPGRQRPERPKQPGKQNSFILVVEDDPPTLRLERVILEEEGYRVEVAGSGEAALDFLNDKSPSLVLLDIGLPGMDGFATCAKIREISQVPIIMVTARDRLDDKIKGMDGGADDYVTKPFLTHELATRVKALLRRTVKISSEPPQVDQAPTAVPVIDPQQAVDQALTAVPVIDPQQAVDQAPTAVPVIDPQQAVGASVPEGTESSSALLQETPEAPSKADRVAESPMATGRSFEGTVRLTITTLGPVRNLINFVSDLRQSPKFRLLRLVANQRTEGMDIWLGLRGPMPLIEILTEVHGVHSVVPGDIPDKETADQLLEVTLT